MDFFKQAVNHIEEERLTSVRLGVPRENKISDL